MGWEKMTRSIASRNQTFKLTAVEEDTGVQVQAEPYYDFKKFNDHTIKAEKIHLEYSIDVSDSALSVLRYECRSPHVN